MKVLLDTHAFIWFVSGNPQLGSAARALIIDPQNDVLISLASLWEISIKVSIGKLKLTEPPQPWIVRALRQNQLNVMPIELSHVFAIASLPHHHRDPFDRMIIVQSLIATPPCAKQRRELRRLWRRSPMVNS